MHRLLNRSISRRRLGAIEILSGCGLLVLLLTAAVGGSLPPEILTIGGLTVVFTFGAGYADIRSKANAAHRRLDEKKADDKEAADHVSEELKRMSNAIEQLTLALARNGINVDLRGQHP